jgi:hypothetical protein
VNRINDLAHFAFRVFLHANRPFLSRFLDVIGVSFRSDKSFRFGNHHRFRKEKTAPFISDRKMKSAVPHQPGLSAWRGDFPSRSPGIFQMFSSGSS